jgi:hypothetical protein
MKNRFGTASTSTDAFHLPTFEKAIILSLAMT